MAGRSCVNLRPIKHVYDVKVARNTILATVTNHPDAITEWINGVEPDGNTVDDRMVGFEIELHDTFPPIGTVQLCVDVRCLVIQLVPDVSPFPASLSDFLGDPRNIFVGFLMEEKLSMLEQQVPIRVESRMIRRLDLPPRLLDNKKKVFDKIGLASVENDWGRTTMLSDMQVQYACTDAFFNLYTAIRIVQNLRNNPAAGS